ncbi:hypothetical protein BCL57_002904 [Agromyces flavus]|uniref:DNA modification methylase n=2 Tax=Agromyces flavus TaxID=589382 RepID=A0A1H1M7A6_9MICO|nr:hypothetical protein [Agromyces flavus]MCP2368728.1 hypothetical protein [Agromyces flavus]SDR82626.1 hypothetical protein SAMN04489721_0358 [Agromyces flavus]
MKARLAASAALALGIAIGGSGCAMITYQATTEKYDASDGVSADLGTIELRNMLVVSDDGEQGNLVVAVVNTGEDDATVEFEVVDSGERFEVDVDAGDVVSLGAGDEDPITIEDLGAEVGGLVAIYAQHSGEEGQEIQVPVLDGRLPEYEDLAP